MFIRIIMTLASVKQVNLVSLGLMKVNNALNHLTTSGCYETCGVPRFHYQEVCELNQFCILTSRIKEIHGIVSFSKLYFCIIAACGPLVHLSHVGYIWIVLWVSRSSKPTGVTHACSY